MKLFFASIFGVLFAVLLTSAAPAQLQPWNDQINTPLRFKVLSEFGNAAVWDKETGLVWEKTPSTSGFNWYQAHEHCIRTNIGNRRGWRLPTLQELESLFNPSVPAPGPALPTGHPFIINGLGSYYWTATTYALITSSAWQVQFVNGAGFPAQDTKTDSGWLVWCVRGGPGVAAQ